MKRLLIWTTVLLLAAYLTLTDGGRRFLQLVQNNPTDWRNVTPPGVGPR